jgi:hypothetical protein
MIPKRDITELNTLGRGGYGTVVQGAWKPDTPVALKKLYLGTLTERAKSDIKREAYMMSMVHSHPNVCKCYGLVLEEPNECALVMELYPRGSLLQLLHDDCTVLTWRSKLQLALDVAKGMAHLHTRQRPIVHGDLKPGNILVQVHWPTCREHISISSGHDPIDGSMHGENMGVVLSWLQAAVAMCVPGSWLHYVLCTSLVRNSPSDLMLLETATRHCY